VVRTLVDGEAGRGLTEAVWDGRDDRGADVPTGAYFIRLEGAGETRVERVLFLR
jgi:flagellar hook assembly protein FlgD